MATNEFTPTADSNRFAFDFLNDELDTLLALSTVLMNHIEDQQEKEDVGITAWRLSQVLSERLSSVEFTNNMRLLLLGRDTA